MPYTIKTNDGITIQGIPDNVSRNSPELLLRIAKERAERDREALYQPGEAAPAEPGLMERAAAIPGQIAEAFTGSERATAETQVLPDWATMPELNSFSLASAKTGLGTMLSNPGETVQVIQSNFPGVAVRQDDKGNFILKSSIDGKDYAIKPGFQVSDVPRAAGGIAAFTPAGRATSIAGAGAAAGATQAGIEATQAGTGGEFNPADVAIAAGGGAAFPAAGRVLAAVKPAVSRAVAAVKSRLPGSVQAPPVAAMVPDTLPPIPAAAAVPDALPMAAAPDTLPMTERPIPTVAQMVPEDLGALTRKASGNGFGAANAQIKLAEMAAINPEAKAAATRLGIDLPFDVFSDSPQMRELVGMTRSQAGSEASGAWRETVSAAVDKADDVIKQFDAAFVEGSPAVGAVSQKVRDSLTGTRAQLANEAKAIYSEIDKAVPKASKVTLPNVVKTLREVRQEVGERQFTTEERRLLGLVENGTLPYGGLIREKDAIGRALAGKASPYGSLQESTLKRLYGALAEDQLAAVGSVGGEPLRQQLRGANLIYAKERALGKRIVNAFGNDVDGSIANAMRTAITSSAKGDSAGFAKLIKVVPEDLRRETVATAIASVARSGRGAERGGFGFSEFADMYRGIRANPPVYKQIVDILGPDSAKVLRDLYSVSRRITDARANVLTTGKANQGMLGELRAESLVGKVMAATAGRAAVSGVAAAGGGPVAAAATSALLGALQSGKKDAVKAAGELFASDAFQKLATEAATGEPSKRAIRAVLTASAFRKFADAVGIPREMTAREQWLLAALQTAQNEAE